MSAPLVWILLPALGGALLAGAQDRIRYADAAGIALAGILAALAWLVPIDSPIVVRSLVFRLEPSLVVLGRSLQITPGLAGLVAMSYSALVAWFLVSRLTPPGRLFIPLGLVIHAFLIAAVAVQPWVFAGMFLFLASLIAIPVLTTGEDRPPPSVLKFLSFQAIGLPLLLLASSMLTGFESAPPGLEIVRRPLIFLAFGFVFLMALFPFHAWIPRIFEETEMISSGFLLAFLPGCMLILALQQIDRYVWLRGSAEVFAWIQALALPTVIFGSVLAAYQDHLGRVLGYTTLTQSGFLVMALGAGPQEGALLIIPLLAARSFGLLAAGVGAAFLARSSGSLTFAGIRGLGRREPIPAAIFLGGLLATAGLPLLAGFAPQVALIQGLGEASPFMAWAVAAAGIGLVIGAARGLAALLAAPVPTDSTSAETSQADRNDAAVGAHLEYRRVGLVVLGLLLLAAGVFPRWVETAAGKAVGMFQQLFP